MLPVTGRNVQRRSLLLATVFVLSLLALLGLLKVTAQPTAGAEAAERTLAPDAGGIVIFPTSGLTTTEAGGVVTFTVVLTSTPAFSVTIPLTSSDATEGVVAPTAVIFLPGNWNTPQIVTVSGVNDDVDDDNVAYSIVTAPAVSGDEDYSGLNAANVAVVNVDDDTAGFTVTPTSGLSTNEAGITDTFTVRLNSQPTANVTFNLSSNDTSEGSVSPGSLTFTALNWASPRTVIVTGVNDDVDDDDQPYNVVTGAATSSDDNYDGLNPPNVVVTNADDDTAGIAVDPIVGLITEEDGSEDSFTVVLNSEPTANVSLNLSSSDVGEGTVLPASLTFTPANWNTPRTVTVTGEDDLVDDGDQPYQIVTAAATSSDGKYSGLNAADVAVTNLDDDGAGISIDPLSDLVTTEAGGSDSFTIELDTEPTADVTIALSSSDSEEGSVSPSSVTFTDSNWDTPQTVTVTGVNDDEADGDVIYSVITAPADSGDPAYDDMNSADVTVTNVDNDTAGIIVTPTVGLVTSEDGDTVTFSVRLNSRPAPSTEVLIPLSSSDSGEGTVGASSLTITRQNWNVWQIVIVTGVDDDIVDGDVAYTIVTGPAVSDDDGYEGLNAADVQAVNQDRDSHLFLPVIAVIPPPVWEQVGNEPAGVAKFYTVAVCGSQSFAGADNGLYRLVGNSWQQQAGLPVLLVSGIAFGSDCNTVFVGTRGQGGGQGTWRGDLAGGNWTWQRVDTAAATSDDEVWDIVVRSDIVYVATNGGIFWATSPTSAQVWNATNITGLATGLNLNEDGTIFAAVWNNGVYQAAAGSQNWTKLGNIGDSLVYQAAQTSSSFRVAGTQSRVYHWSSGDWQPVNSFVSTTFAAAAVDGRLYAGQRNNGVLVSEDGGQSWATMNEEMAMPAGEEFQVRGFFVDSEGYLYAATTSGVWRWSAAVRN